MRMAKSGIVSSLMFQVGLVAFLDKIFWSVRYTNEFIEHNQLDRPDELRQLFLLGHRFGDLSLWEHRRILLNNLSFPNVFLDYFFRFPLPVFVYAALLFVGGFLVLRAKGVFDGRPVGMARETPFQASSAGNRCPCCGAIAHGGDAFCGACGNRLC